MAEKEMHDYVQKRAADFLDSWLRLRARQVDLPGFSVAVSQGSRVVFHQAYGWADVERNVPLTTGHLFSIGSQSKMLTATAAMQLAEEGKLGLDEPVITYLPWLAEHADKRYRSISVRHLLAHASGMARDAPDSNYWQSLHPFPDAAGLRQAVLAARLVYPVNTRLKYSNLGYGLLGQVIGAVSGLPYAEYVTKHVTRPLALGMTTVPKDPAAVGYGDPLDGQRLATSLPVSTGALDPAVGWYATAADMCRLAYGHMAPNLLLAQTSKDEMHRSYPRRHIPPPYRHLEYGLGFQRLRLDGRLLLGHSGSFFGHRTCTFFDPGRQVSVAIMANSQDAPFMHMFWGVLQALDFFDRSMDGPTPPRLQKFNLQVVNPRSIVEIVATDKRIVSFYHQDWKPLSALQELEYVNSTTLKFKNSHPFLLPGEQVVFTCQDKKVVEVSLAGSTMLPLEMA
ncbi:MAG TPA: serine hydrolase domain-containing protein [Candidatus Limnocylindria bacterium]|nr:serine hydrolase domain-containing protein [Candidatus Limnocylindria bacterium]